MYGIGIWNGLRVTLKHFVDTYVADLAQFGTKRTPETFEIRQGMKSKGLVTVEYPDEKIAVPERFRFIPFLVVNNYDDPHAPGHDWCTSCGICAKVCPPQCIWIVRGNDPQTGRPKPEPEAFYIDIDICMNCGYCAEYCPFDAIKMDHDYEQASYDRTTSHIFDKKKLSKEVRYWQSIAPTTALEEAILRGQWEHKDTLKIAKKAGIEMTEPVWENRGAATHNPDIVAARQTTSVPAAPPAGAPAAAPAARPAGISINVEGATPDQLAEWAANEALPLPARAAAALRLESMISNKEFKPAPTHRKGVSAAKKTAKDQNTTIEDAAKDFQSGAVVLATPATPTLDEAPASVAEVAPVVQESEEAAPTVAVMPIAAGNLATEIAAARELERKSRDKEIKLTSADRKRIAEAKKAAKDAGIEW
jgi:NADH-quinone oxidoreductase subunit I